MVAVQSFKRQLSICDFHGIWAVFYLFSDVHADEVILVLLYPAAYAVTNNWGIHNIWFCLFLAWTAKQAILRYGELKAHRKAIPLFLGLILGEFTVGSLWTIIGILFGISTYGFYT